MLQICCLALAVASAMGLYSSSLDVIDLTDKNFDKLVMYRDEIWIVEFFAPWCGHCQQFVPVYEKVAKALKGVIKVGAVDSQQYRSFASRYEIRHYPTVKIFGANKDHPYEIKGNRRADDIIDAGIREIRDKIDVQLGRQKTSDKAKDPNAENVIELTDSNFDEMVMKSEDMWMVEFYAPWCGHCKSFGPIWAAAATKLKGKVKFGALDATDQPRKAVEYAILQYPTVKAFPSGKKDRESVFDFTHLPTTEEELIEWALDKKEAEMPVPDILQITDGKMFAEATDDKQLCVIVFLPHIFDCQAECRNDYLEIFKQLGEKFKKKPWGWVWTEAGSQPELEHVLDVGGFGYPAMVVVSTKKMMYSIFRGSFSREGLGEFLRDLNLGRGNAASVRGAHVPEIITTDPWDGEDAVLPMEGEFGFAEEEFDLTDDEMFDEKDEL